MFIIYTSRLRFLDVVGMEKAPVVADASVLIHLSRIGRFELLRQLYETIVIPKGVYTEVVEVGWSLPGSVETERGIKEGWIKVVSVGDRLAVRELVVRPSHGQR